MTEERCECCDLLTSSCGRSLEQRRHREEERELAASLAMPGVIPARYAGGCAGCEEHLEAGAPIRRIADGWIGALCCPDLR